MAKTNLNNRKQKSMRTKKNRIPQSRNTIKKRPVTDARQKIIQKKRTTVVDARDVLAKMAKTQDARSKLIKLRQNQRGTMNGNSNVKVIGNIVQKIDRNGKISLSTKKPTKQPANSTANINMAIQKQLGLISPNKRNLPKKNAIKRNVPAPNPLPIRKTILNDINFSQPAEDIYKWTKPQLQTASDLIHSLEIRNRPVLHDDYIQGWHTYPQNKVMAMDYIADEEMPLMPVQQRSTISLQGSSRVSNVLSRLEAKPVSQTHGILSQTKTKVVVPAGHRIVVSNLQPTVTQDDIKELFEDIGQLLAARLVRSGVAEVIYKNLKDAQKAVDTYHNRQLDGFPMKCLLVNKRPINQPTASSLTKPQSQGVLASSRKISANSNSLVPDISTIHKVLFQRK